jgi:hypothetical protein
MGSKSPRYAHLATLIEESPSTCLLVEVFICASFEVPNLTTKFSAGRMTYLDLRLQALSEIQYKASEPDSTIE